MRDTVADLEWLDASVSTRRGFLDRSFEMPERSPSARRLVGRLAGMLTVALATVTARDEPRVAPISAFVRHARFCVPTVAEAARARQLARRPAASLTWFDGRPDAPHLEPTSATRRGDAGRAAATRSRGRSPAAPERRGPERPRAPGAPR
ncbi:MAG: pyridoxamine 5'-phosphate oxidase family protein [Solirubrobacterales bacterium]|nr:pyridoxamine 5'-phosphate oxidase family protein [Solirubrobacterales bacterium]